MKMDMLPSSAVFPTLMSEVGKSLNVSASAAFVESCGKGSAVTYCPLHVLPFATPTFLADILQRQMAFPYSLS